MVFLSCEFESRYPYLFFFNGAQLSGKASFFGNDITQVRILLFQKYNIIFFSGCIAQWQSNGLLIQWLKVQVLLHSNLNEKKIQVLLKIKNCCLKINFLKKDTSLILAQSERQQYALHMLVERKFFNLSGARVSNT